MKTHLNILRIMASVMKTVYKPLLLPAYFIILFYILLCQHFCEFFILSLHSKEEVLFLIKRLEKHPFNQMKILTWLVSPTSVAIKKKSEHNYFSKNAKIICLFKHIIYNFYQNCPSGGHNSLLITTCYSHSVTENNYLQNKYDTIPCYKSLI